MPLAFPLDRTARQFDTQYMFGDSLLVAPIVRAGGNVEVYLPVNEGCATDGDAWYDYWTGARLVGGQILHYRDLPLDRLPVFVRAGTVVPHTRAHNRAQEWQGDIDITELAVCGEPDFGYGVTQYFLKKHGAGGWRATVDVDLVKHIV